VRLKQTGKKLSILDIEIPSGLSHSKTGAKLHAGGSHLRAVARKYFVLIEFIDIFTQACKVCIHDEDVAETDVELTFKTPKGFRYFKATSNPTTMWTAQQIIEAFPWDTAPKYLPRDRDSIYGAYFRQRIKNMGIKEVITAPQSPWQNPFVERLIGSTRRDCLDHAIVLKESHLSRILSSYFDYYHHDRTHIG
jgi:hypothetical protein